MGRAQPVGRCLRHGVKHYAENRDGVHIAVVVEFVQSFISILGVEIGRMQLGIATYFPLYGVALLPIAVVLYVIPHLVHGITAVGAGGGMKQEGLPMAGVYGHQVEPYHSIFLLKFEDEL